MCVHAPAAKFFKCMDIIFIACYYHMDMICTIFSSRTCVNMHATETEDVWMHAAVSKKVRERGRGRNAHTNTHAVLFSKSQLACLPGAVWLCARDVWRVQARRVASCLFTRSAINRSNYFKNAVISRIFLSFSSL